MIKFNEVTWYSKLAAIIFFIGILPAFTFYIGTQFEDVKKSNENNTIAVTFVNQQSLNATTTISANPALNKKDILPTSVGQCVITSVVRVENRLESGETGPFIQGSGSAIEYSNGGYQVSYDQVPEIDSSKPGDKIELCLLSVPENCPTGDDRGKFYSATNLRTKGSWKASDSEHSCGGA